MRVIFGKCFGLGNAVQAVPALKAFSFLGHDVDVLVGSLPDDAGARDVMGLLRDRTGVIRRVFVDSVPRDIAPYDLAVMSIPFDGRWQNGVHYRAASVMDCRGRPEYSKVFGFSSWKAHEVEYQMENARALGYRGEIPDCSFGTMNDCGPIHRTFYLGIGYKKDAAGYWKAKHWGNERFAALVNRILDDHPVNQVYTSGDMADLQLTINPIRRMVRDQARFQYVPGGIAESIGLVSYCETYVGNDTGMAHVAAACGNRVVTVHQLGEQAMRKSCPWCPPERRRELLAAPDRSVTVDDVLLAIRELQG